jgi:hypothetical protein
MWNEGSEALFKTLPRHSHGVTEEDTKTLSQDSRCHADFRTWLFLNPRQK